MTKISYITSNSYKFKCAQLALQDTGIELIQENIETPEIQSDSVKEIASFSARWASEKLNKPIVLTDGGFFIKSLNGFPGPFTKYIHQMLTTDDMLRLMDGIEDRGVSYIECLAYCEPGKEPICFMGIVRGTIAKTKGKPGMTSINAIFIPEGYDNVESEIEVGKMCEYWSSLNHWGRLISRLDKQYILDIACK